MKYNLVENILDKLIIKLKNKIYPFYKICKMDILKIKRIVSHRVFVIKIYFYIVSLGFHRDHLGGSAPLLIFVQYMAFVNLHRLSLTYLPQHQRHLIKIDSNTLVQYQRNTLLL